MAYRRRFTKRRYRKQPWYRKKYNAYQLAQKAWSATKYIKGLVNSEMLTMTNQAAGSTFNYDGAVLNLCNISQGDTISGRTGNSIFLRSILLKISFTDNLSSTVPATFKCILFIDTQQVGDTVPAMSDVLQTTGSGYSTLSPLNINNAGRFKILKTWTFHLDPNIMRNKVIDYYRSIRHHVRYNGTAGSDIQKGGVYFGYIIDRNTNLPTITYYTKVGYHDN